MFSSILRIAILFVPLSIAEMTMMFNCFDKRKAFWPFVCVWILRISLILPLYAPVGALPLSIMRFCMGAQLVLTPLQSAVYVWIFYNETTPVVKILGIGLLWEGFASIIMSIAILSTNILEGYPNLSVTEVFRPFQMPDLLVPVFAVVVYSFIYYKGTAMFAFIRQYQIKHPVLISLFVVPLYIYGFITSINPVTYGYFVFYTITAILSIITAFVLFAYMYTITNQRKVLRASSQMVNDHYQLLQSRIDDLEHQQNEINAKMAVLVAQNFPEDLTQRYLNDMKTIKDNLYQTLYTHYYMIDAILSSKAKDYQKRSIDFQCQCAGLELKHLSQVQVAQVLMTLFRYIDLYDNQSLKLKLSSYNNQVIIVVDPTSNIGIAGLKRQLNNQLTIKDTSIQKKHHTIYLSLTD